jgi:hypothetical protein
MQLNFDPGVELPPELVLWAVPNIREYFYTKI